MIMGGNIKNKKKAESDPAFLVSYLENVLADLPPDSK